MKIETKKLVKMRMGCSMQSEQTNFFNTEDGRSFGFEQVRVKCDNPSLQLITQIRDKEAFYSDMIAGRNVEEDMWNNNAFIKEDRVIPTDMSVKLLSYAEMLVRMNDLKGIKFPYNVAILDYVDSLVKNGVKVIPTDNTTRPKKYDTYHTIMDVPTESGDIRLDIYYHASIEEFEIDVCPPAWFDLFPKSYRRYFVEYDVERYVYNYGVFIASINSKLDSLTKKDEEEYDKYFKLNDDVMNAIRIAKSCLLVRQPLYSFDEYNRISC